ncbi:unnamed protein product, partial [Prorocentrum cordatum]
AGEPLGMQEALADLAAGTRAALAEVRAEVGAEVREAAQRLQCAEARLDGQERRWRELRAVEESGSRSSRGARGSRCRRCAGRSAGARLRHVGMARSSAPRSGPESPMARTRPWRTVPTRLTSGMFLYRRNIPDLFIIIRCRFVVFCFS